MSGPEFFQTIMGKRFFESTVPELVRQIGRLADGVERLNANLESQAAASPAAHAEASPTTQDG